MLVSYRWLTELLPALRHSPLEVAEALTGLGLAVDGVSDHESALRPVVIATVKSIEPHPERDSLRLVTIETRSGSAEALSAPSLPPGSTLEPSLPAELTVVCGAKNVPEPGGQVVFAGVGAKLPGVGFRLTPKKIGGIESCGMLCSESELGLAAESDGITVLAQGSFQSGTRFIDAFPEGRDVIFELDVTPNRPDALGHIGVARDLAALYEIDLVLPQAKEVSFSGVKVSDELQVDNQDHERCGRYAAGLVRGIKVAPAPDAMRWRLHRLGIRPVNNVVDITNWVLLESGQPMHAFDQQKLNGGKVVIRRAQQGEKLITLDQVERELIGDDLLICDAKGPTALAGIMGGADSEISPGTANVVLESAYFEPRGIRRSSKRLGIHSDSSHRFERGVDFGSNEIALERARALLVELGGGVAAEGIVTAEGEVPELPAIELRAERLNGLLGTYVPLKQATKILSALGFAIEYLADTEEGGVASLRGATHRPDVSIEEDLIEEVARVRGLDAIPTELPAIPAQRPRSAGQWERRAAEVAVGLGLSEALTYAFVSSNDLERLSAPEAIVSLQHPLSADRSVLRTSIAPGLLEALSRARRRGERSLRLFAVGSIFLSVATPEVTSEARPREDADRGVLPYERPIFGALLAGPRAGHLELNPGDHDIYDAKSVALEFVERSTGRKAEVKWIGASKRTAHLHPRGAAGIYLDGKEVGIFGPLHPDVVDAFDLEEGALLLEVDLSLLMAAGVLTPKYERIPKLPAVQRDLSLVVTDTRAAEEVRLAILAAAGELCESVEVAAEYRGGSVPEGSRSLTFRAVYRDPKAKSDPENAKTLTDKEVDKVQTRALAQVQKDLGATLRA